VRLQLGEGGIRRSDLARGDTALGEVARGALRRPLDPAQEVCLHLQGRAEVDLERVGQHRFRRLGRPLLLCGGRGPAGAW
jgi:hypothetical protein